MYITVYQYLSLKKRSSHQPAVFYCVGKGICMIQAFPLFRSISGAGKRVDRHNVYLYLCLSCSWQHNNIRLFITYPWWQCFVCFLAAEWNEIVSPNFISFCVCISSWWMCTSMKIKQFPCQWVFFCAHPGTGLIQSDSSTEYLFRANLIETDNNTQLTGIKGWITLNLTTYMAPLTVIRV